MLEYYMVSPEQTIREVITAMDKRKMKAVAVVDKDKKLLGLFSHGDMRRYFLHDGDLSKNITEGMNSNPIVFKSVDEVETSRKSRIMVAYPIVDENRKLLDFIYEEKNDENSIVSDELENVPLVIMAGGKGTRLYPYTKILPKALIPIGDMTITERIINIFKQYGCNQVYMVLNHKANMIKAYFNEIEKDYTVSYVEEGKFLGTGGGLGLLKGKIKETFFLSNCDILINADLECIYKTHKKEKNKITFVCAMKDMIIPYGVIETTSNGEIREFREKPGFSFLTNTGMYVIEPDVIEDLKENEFIHLPDIAKRYMERGEKIGVFPISEKSWMDMGQFSEMESMIKSLGV